MKEMYYVYVLRSKNDSKLYIGYTNDLKKRFKLHNDGKVVATKHRKPFELIYYEASFDKSDALTREKYLKTTYGHRYIHKRIKNYLGEN